MTNEEILKAYYEEDDPDFESSTNDRLLWLIEKARQEGAAEHRMALIEAYSRLIFLSTMDKIPANEGCHDEENYWREKLEAIRAQGQEGEKGE